MRAHIIHSAAIALPAFACFLFGARGLAHAAEPLRLADVVEQARQSNPQIRASRERAGALAAVPRRAAALDDPTVSYELWNAPDFRPDRADNNIIRLSQKLPFPGKRALAGTMAEDEAEAARASFSKRRRRSGLMANSQGRTFRAISRPRRGSFAR